MYISGFDNFHTIITEWVRYHEFSKSVSGGHIGPPTDTTFCKTKLDPQVNISAKFRNNLLSCFRTVQ